MRLINSSTGAAVSCSEETAAALGSEWVPEGDEALQSPEPEPTPEPEAPEAPEAPEEPVKAPTPAPAPVPAPPKK